MSNNIIAVNTDRFSDLQELDIDSTHPTRNQLLAGIPNTRTLVHPTIVAPIADLYYWRTNPNLQYSQINTRKISYPIMSGWEGSYIPQQPNVYTATESFQPINSTNGIAITPQFPKNTTLYVDSDSPIPDFPDSEIICEPNIYNTFDPRFSGSGSDDRTYFDEVTGTNKYFYDDIDAIRMPNYLTRSKIDFTSFADSYGKVDSGNLSLDGARGNAEREWIDDSLAFRESLMKSLMRKRNEEQVQKRLAPKRTYGGARRFGY